MSDVRRLDRRKFLTGTGGAVLALPMLELFAPRMARGAVATPPKRLIIVTHSNGRIVGAQRQWDRWSPGTTSGPLPAGALSPFLAALAPIRDEIVTVDGVDNVIRQAYDGDGHVSSAITLLTGRFPDVARSRGGGPSLDYVAGTMLRPNASMRPSVVLPASATPVGVYYQNALIWGDSGTDPTILSGNPDQSVGELLRLLRAGHSATPTTRSTFRDRLRDRRKSLLDGVADGITSLRGRLGTRDRERLDLHTQFIRNLETRVAGPGGGGGGVAAASCSRPDTAHIPHVPTSTWDEYTAAGGPDPGYVRDYADDITTPYQIENLVMALACDVTRVAVFGLCEDPTWSSEFSGPSPFLQSDGVHLEVHGAPSIQTPEEVSRASNLAQGFQRWGRQFAQLIQRLAAVEDVDGSRLLDNTLVVWVSELGYGADHLTYNIPVVLAGMRNAFAQGQGRHLNHENAPRTTSDLCAQVLRMLGGTSMTFGETGTLGGLISANGSHLVSGPGRPGFVNSSTLLHSGALDL